MTNKQKIGVVVFIVIIVIGLLIAGQGDMYALHNNLIH